MVVLRKWSIISLATVCICFIGLNAYLIWKENSQVQHTVYVDSWTRVQERDVVKTIEAKGIMMPQDEYKVYFNPEDKEFLRFLVKEGDEVTPETPLLEYSTPSIDQLKESLELEIQQAEGEISSINQYISDLVDYQATVGSSSSSYQMNPTFLLEEGLDLEQIEDKSSDAIISAIEQAILKQEFEKDKLEDKVLQYEAQLNLVNEKSGSAMVISEIDGIVKDVNDQLGNPIVTIASKGLAIEGLLTEEQVTIVKDGMSFKATVGDKNTKLTGTIAKINHYPEKEPAIEKENNYQFQAILKEPADALPIGTNVTVSIITDEARNVPTVLEKVVVQNKNNKPYIYTLTNEGIVAKKAIKTGLNFNGIQEIKGAEIGEVVMFTNNSLSVNKENFVTTLKPTSVKKDSFKQLSKTERWEAFLIGLVEK